jgi:hypothetical protein
MAACSREKLLGSAKGPEVRARGLPRRLCGRPAAASTRDRRYRSGWTRADWFDVRGDATAAGKLMDCGPFPKIQSLKTLPRGESSGVKKPAERNEHAKGGSQFAFGLSRRKTGGDWMRMRCEIG